MKIIKPKDTWTICINNNKCPFLYYPSNYFGCKLLPDKDGDNYCNKDKCPIELSHMQDMITQANEMDKLDEEFLIEFDKNNK